VNRFPVPLLTITTFIAVALAVACGGGDALPGRQDAPPVSPVGSYEDRNGARSFTDDLDTALEDRDLEFFLENVAFQKVSCTQESPASPASCLGRESGAAVPAILVGVWEGEDFYLDAPAYEQFMLGFLTEAVTVEGDAYGGPEAALYAYAVIRPEFQVAPPAQERVEAILTRIAPDGERRALIVTLGFDGQRWTVTQLVDGPATFLDPAGPKPPPESGFETIFDFWAPWQE